jgi:hypothetical protein
VAFTMPGSSPRVASDGVRLKLRCFQSPNSGSAISRKKFAQALVAPEDSKAETSVARFIADFRKQIADAVELAPASKSRREIAIKALLKTWPDLPLRTRKGYTQQVQGMGSPRAARGDGICCSEGKPFAHVRLCLQQTGKPKSVFTVLHSTDALTRCSR